MCLVLFNKIIMENKVLKKYAPIFQDKRKPLPSGTGFLFVYWLLSEHYDITHNNDGKISFFKICRNINVLAQRIVNEFLKRNLPYNEFDLVTVENWLFFAYKLHGKNKNPPEKLKKITVNSYELPY